MRKHIIFALCIFTSFSIEAASFNCEEAIKPTDITICGDQTLSALDSENMNLYKHAKALDSIQTKEILKKSIVGKYKCNVQRECIEDVYRQTISLYTDIINSTKVKDIQDTEKSIVDNFSRQELFSRAQSAYQSGDYDRAIILVKPLAEKGDAEAQLSLGVTYERGIKDYAEGIRWYKSAAEQGNATAQLMIGTMYLKGRGVVADKVTGIKWIQLAAELGLESAIRVLKEIAEEASKDKAGIQNLPDKANESNNEQSPAMLPADKELEEDAETFFNRGNDQYDLKRLDEALASYDRAIVLKPDYADAYYNRGSDLNDLNRQDEALASYDRAITLKPKYAEAYCNRGNVLLELKKYDKALLNYDKAIALKPDFAEAYFNRANALEHLNQLDRAKLSHNRAIALKPELSEVLSDLNIKKQTQSKQLGVKHTPQIETPKDNQAIRSKINWWPLRVVLITLIIFLYLFYRKL